MDLAVCSSDVLPGLLSGVRRQCSHSSRRSTLIANREQHPNDVLLGTKSGHTVSVKNFLSHDLHVVGPEGPNVVIIVVREGD